EKNLPFFEKIIVIISKVIKIKHDHLIEDCIDQIFIFPCLIQNPVGKDKIYKGKWKEDSVEWTQIDSKITEILSADKSQSPNQFLMDYDEFFNTFTTMNILHPNYENPQSGFKFSQIHNEWIAGENSGGCGYYPAVYWTNPQHEFDIPPSVKHSMGLISIIQKDDPETRISQSEAFWANLEQIGFHVYAIKPNAVKNSRGNYEKPDMKRVATVKTFKRQRQVAKRVFLPPSKYIIMPCTYDKDKSAKYLLQYYFDIQDKYEDKESNGETDNGKDVYEKWYFEGMSDKDIENITRKAQSASSAACLIIMYLKHGTQLRNTGVEWNEDLNWGCFY
ncbi:calpain-1 catalytic subunit-like, partial [Brachionus plicatilis]